MGNMGTIPAVGYESSIVQTFSSPTGTSHTMTYAANVSDMVLVINNVIQEPTVAYTTSGTTLTTATLVSGDTMYINYLALSRNTVTPGADTVTNAMMVDDAVGLDELSATGTPSSSMFLRGDNSWAAAGGLTLGTPVATTSGTSITFGSIPAGTKRIVLSFVGVSTSGGSIPETLLGDAGGLEASGYLGSVARIDASPVFNNFTTEFKVAPDHAGSVIYHGFYEFILVDASTFTWVMSGRLGKSDTTSAAYISGSKSLSAELTQISFTTAGGSDTFDAGKMNILYE